MSDGEKTYTIKVTCTNCGEGGEGLVRPYEVSVPIGTRAKHFLPHHTCRTCG